MRRAGTVALEVLSKLDKTNYWFFRVVPLLSLLFVVWHLRRATLILLWCMLVAIPFCVAATWVRFYRRS